MLKANTAVLIIYRFPFSFHVIKTNHLIIKNLYERLFEIRLSLHFSISFIGFLLLLFWRSKNNYFLYFIHRYLLLTGLPTGDRQPKTSMPNS